MSPPRVTVKVSSVQVRCIDLVSHSEKFTVARVGKGESEQRNGKFGELKNKSVYLALK